MCLLSNEIKDYHFVSQGKTNIPGVDDGADFQETDVSDVTNQELLFQMCGRSAALETGLNAYLTKHVTQLMEVDATVDINVLDLLFQAACSFLAQTRSGINLYTLIQTCKYLARHTTLHHSYFQILFSSVCFILIRKQEN